MLHFYPLNELISNLMLATGLKKVGKKSKTFWEDSAGRTSSNIRSVIWLAIKWMSELFWAGGSLEW